MQNSFKKGLIAIIRNGVTGEKISSALLTESELIVQLAKRHQICGLMLCGLMNSGLSSDAPVCRSLFPGALAETVLHEQQANAISEIFTAFDEKGFCYMPLKGTILKELYPRPEYRFMSDTDILIKETERKGITAEMHRLGFEQVLESDHEIIWRRGTVTIELHKHLIPSYNSDYHGYFADVWDKAKPISSGRYALDANNEFVYIFTHFAKHYRDGGIGIKHFADLWLLLTSRDIDEEFVINELAKLHLDKFYKNVKATLEMWFGDGKSNEIIDIITETVLSSGAYGSSEHQLTARVTRNAKKSKSRFGAMLTMIFPSVRVLAPKYKYLEKLPILLPWANAVFVHRERISRGARYLKVANSDATLKHEEALRKVGIEYHL